MMMAHKPHIIQSSVSGWDAWSLQVKTISVNLQEHERALLDQQEHCK